MRNVDIKIIKRAGRMKVKLREHPNEPGSFYLSIYPQVFGCIDTYWRAGQRRLGEELRLAMHRLLKSCATPARKRRIKA